MSAGCAVSGDANGSSCPWFGGIWRSGALTESPVVREASVAVSRIKLSVFYLGTPQLKASTPINVPTRRRL